MGSRSLSLIITKTPLMYRKLIKETVYEASAEDWNGKLHVNGCRKRIRQCKVFKVADERSEPSCRHFSMGVESLTAIAGVWILLKEFVVK